MQNMNHSCEYITLQEKETYHKQSIKFMILDFFKTCFLYYVYILVVIGCCLLIVWLLSVIESYYGKTLF